MLTVDGHEHKRIFVNLEPVESVINIHPSTGTHLQTWFVKKPDDQRPDARGLPPPWIHPPSCLMPASPPWQPSPCGLEKYESFLHSDQRCPQGLRVHISLAGTRFLIDCLSTPGADKSGQNLVQGLLSSEYFPSKKSQYHLAALP